MRQDQQFLTSLVSGAVARDCAEAPERARSTDAASVPVHAAVLLLDIAGFTPMTERFEGMGPDGVEQLTGTLNHHFGRMIDQILDAGGEIDKLIGDALLAYWVAADLRGLPLAVRRAARAAAELRAGLTDARLGDGSDLSLHATIAAGPVQRIYVGGHEGHRLQLLAGPPLVALRSLPGRARPDEIVLDAVAADCVEAVWPLRRLPGGSACLSVSHAMRAAGTSPLAPEAPEARLSAPPPDPGTLERFLHGALRGQIATGQGAWLAELRQLTAAFLSLDAVFGGPGDDLATLQARVLAIQAIVHDFGGVVQSLTVDDKGTVLLAAFGLPMLSHEDDAVRAVAAMHRVAALFDRGAGGRDAPEAGRDETRPQGWAAQVGRGIGIGTGTMFCGFLGNDRWRSFSVRGTVANRTARLMGKADGGVLVDEPTRMAASRRFAFAPTEEIALKGLDRPMPVTRLRGETEKAPDPRAAQAAPPGAEAIAGRDAECAAIQEQIETFVQTGTPAALLLNGPTGIGKSTLANAAARIAASAGLAVLRGEVDTLEANSVYAAWHGVFSALFGIAPGDMAAAGQARIAAALPDEPSLRQRLPLLAPLFRLAIPDTALTAQMNAATRADNTATLMHRLLEHGLAGRPTLILLDDCQWMDSASWRFLLDTARAGAPIFFVLCLRSDREKAAPFVEELTALLACREIDLGEMTQPAVAALARSTLGVETLHDDLLALLVSRGGGNPYFTRELLLALREMGHLDTAGGLARLEADIDTIRGAARPSETADSATRPGVLPATLERVIVARLDRLEPELQLTLKTAAVVGRQVALRLLAAVHPMQPALEQCAGDARLLEQRDYLRADADRAVYSFRHIILQEAVYRLLSFANRRSLHAAIAGWMEANLPDAAQTQKVVLAEHWSAAERPERALAYLAGGGGEALRGGAYAEAAALYERARTALGKTGTADDRRLAEIELALGQIYTGLAEPERSFARFDAGFRAMGLRWPKSRAGLGLAILRSAARQILNRLRRLRPDPGRPERHREAMLADGLEKFGHLFFFEQRLPELLLTTLMGLNYAEAANSPARIRRSFAQFSVSLAIARLGRASDHYADAVETLPATGSSDFELAFQSYYLAIHAVGQGRLATAQRHLDLALPRARNIGNRRLEIDLTSFSWFVAYLGADFAQARQLGQIYRDLVDAYRDQQHSYFVRISLGEQALRLSDYAGAHELLREASELLLPGFILDRLHVIGLLALAEHRLGREAQAWALAEAALADIANTPPIGVYALDAYDGVCTIFLDQAEAPAAVLGAEANRAAKLARRALRGFAAFAKSFPLGRARYLLQQARDLTRRGRDAAARRAMEDALAAAEVAGLAYETARARLQLGRADGLDATSRRAHLDEACMLFDRIGLAREAGEARQALSELLQEPRADAVRDGGAGGRAEPPAGFDEETEAGPDPKLDKRPDPQPGSNLDKRRSGPADARNGPRPDRPTDQGGADPSRADQSADP
ncbi:MAG: AAA family ATPase [Pseudomonadota bacterium]